MKNFKGVALAALAAAAAILVPLYGAPRLGSVTHPDWAQMLLRALDLSAIVEQGGGNASLAFEALAWRTTFRIAHDRPFRSVGVEFVSGPPAAARTSSTIPGELGYRLAAARAGDYRVRLKLGDASVGQAQPVAVELTAEGQTKPVKSLSFTPQPLVESEATYLSAGVYTLSVGLPPGLLLESIEVVPPCLNSIEPKGGWKAAAIAQTGDVAVTVLQASDLESELPPAATPIELSSAAFQPMTGQVLRTSLKGDLEGFWLKADASGLQAVVQVNVPEPGLYTVYGYGLAGGGNSWLVDGCFKSVVCPSSERPESPRWRPLLTAEFSSGRHSLAVTLASEAAIQRLKIERKKNSVDDYLATLRRLGLDLGTQRPVTRGEANDAMRFVEEKRRLAPSKCDDIFLPSGALVAGLAMPSGATIGSGAAIPPAPPAGAPIVPLPGASASPLTPASPQPVPASPSPTPVVTPSPSPSPGPSPSPSLGPPPTTLAQPPASPVKE
jgi:hypothetical protein